MLDLDDCEIEVNSSIKGIPFLALYLDKSSPALGQSFSGADLKVGLGFVEANFQGSVVEIGGGWYNYVPHNDEIGLSGFISVRLSRADLDPFMSVATVIAGTTTTLPGGGSGLPKAIMFQSGWLQI